MLNRKNVEILVLFITFDPKCQQIFTQNLFISKIIFNGYK